uniref:PBCV-specific basic adaptor domain-containing protein n=1 Tax=Caenorhabditis tropicalis TaxID=1561998 RepID=A0A1I7U3X6_9PELO
MARPSRHSQGAAKVANKGPRNVGNTQRRQGSTTRASSQAAQPSTSSTSLRDPPKSHDYNLRKRTTVVYPRSTTSGSKRKAPPAEKVVTQGMMKDGRSRFLPKNGYVRKFPKKHGFRSFH